MRVTDEPCDGWWWLLGDEERRVFGRLSAGRSGSWELDLFGTLDEEPTKEWFRRIGDDDRAVPTIRGHLIRSGPEPQFVTLLDCWRRKANRTVGGAVSGARTETWAFREVVMGHGHVTDHERVSGINVRLGGLLEWSGRGWPDASWTEESASASAETIHVGTADVGDQVIELVLDHSLHHAAHGVTITHRAMFDVTPRSQVTLAQAMSEVALPLRDLLAFFSLCHVDVDAVRVRLDDDDGRWQHAWFDYEVSLQRPHAEPDGPQRHRMLATWPALQDDLTVQGLVGGWWALRERVEKTITMLLVPYSAPYLYTDDHVLTAFIAIEAYHDAQINGTSIPAEEHTQRVDAIVASAPAELRQWANDMLRGRNQKGSRRKLAEVVERAGGTGRQVLDAVPEFIDLANKARQNTAHPGSWGGDAGARYLAISYGIRWILRRCLLEDLGLDGVRADGLVTKCPSFVGELELMRRWTHP